MMSTRSRSTILVVDDERGPRESLRMILEPVHRVLQATSGSDALLLLRCETVDLVTVDLNMPGMRGEQLVRTLRSEFPQTSVIVITGCGNVESAAEGVRLGISDYLQKPFDVVHVAAAVGRALAKRHSRGRLMHFLGELGGLVGRERELGLIVGDLQQSRPLRGRLASLFDAASRGASEGSAPRTEEFLEVLAETLESKDSFVHGHARRVALYASLLADRFRLSSRERHDLRLAAFLHDLGKVGIPSDLLKRAGALAPGERATVQEHTALGERLLRPLGIAPAVADAVRHHHEWWDGTGYPDGLAGEDIPLTARIIAVADSYDAMTSDRPYRRALERSVAAAELRRFAGSQFDPEVAAEFLAVLDACVFDSGPDFFADVTLAARSTPRTSEPPRP